MEENKFNKSRNRPIMLTIGILLLSIPIYKIISGEEIHRPFIGMLTLGALLLYGGLFRFGERKKINKKEILAIDAVISIGLVLIVHVLSGSLEASLIIGAAYMISSLRVLAY
jgi:hypothetical protein